MEQPSVTGDRGLGNLVSTYLPVARSVKASKVGAIVFMVLGGAAVIAGVALAFFETVLLCFLPFGLAGIALGLSTLRRGREQSTMKVQVYDHGLVYQHSGEADTYPWDELAVVWQQIISRNYRGGARQTTHTYRIVNRDGRKALFDDRIVGIQGLGEAIQKGSLPPLLSDAMAKYDKGEVLAFGRLLLDEQGIALGRKVLPWDELESAEVRGGRLYLQRAGSRGSWAEILVSDLPNVHSLVAMIRSLKRRQA